MTSPVKPFLDVSVVPDILLDAAARVVLTTFVSWSTELSWWAWDCDMNHVDSAWTNVYSEIEEAGLAYEPSNDRDGGYLHQIRLEVAWMPSIYGELGYVYEGSTWMSYLSGYEEGVIYLPSNRANRAYVPGAGLADVIRHEYAHAWHWLEPDFFETGWFEKAFGRRYDDGTSSPFMDWWNSLVCNDRFQQAYQRARTKRDRARLIEQERAKEFVSWYAATQPCEDFAETFMTYLRFRNNLDKFRSRPGVYRKLKVVEKAVAQARVELGLG